MVLVTLLPRATLSYTLLKKANSILNCQGRVMAMSTAHQCKYFDGKTGQPIDNQTGVFDRVQSFVDRCRDQGKKAVIFIGENHDDPTAHEHELALLKNLFEKKATSSDDDEKKAGVSLSLEFYERDVQPVVDEYLADLIDYETFLMDSRPPNNHQSYRPLLDFCKENSMSVWSANCARRYSRMVGQKGRGKLEEVFASNPDFYSMALPPLPYQRASERYCNKFKEIMGVVASDKSNERIMKMLDSQTLWDASMAHTIAAKAWSKSDVTVQVCGYFHCQYFLGIGEHLARYYDPDKFEAFTLVVFPEDPEELVFNDEEHRGIADVLIMSDISRLV